MNTYRNYLRSKRLVPKVFLEENHIEEIKGVYVPFWLYDSTQSFSGSYDCTKVRTWSDSRYFYTETSHYDVERAGTESFSYVPVDGSKEMPDDLMESLEPFDHSQMVPFNMGYLAGFLANKYNVDSDQCRPRASERMANSTAADFRNTISGYSSVHPRSEKCNTVDINHKYALYPVYILNTTWNGNNYLFAMNGQSGKFIGNLPFSLWRAMQYYFPIAGIVAAIAFVIMTFLL